MRKVKHNDRVTLEHFQELAAKLAVMSTEQGEDLESEGLDDMANMMASCLLKTQSSRDLERHMQNPVFVAGIMYGIGLSYNCVGFPVYITKNPELLRTVLLDAGLQMLQQVSTDLDEIVKRKG